jgi:hypothetical protein
MDARNMCDAGWYDIGGWSQHSPLSFCCKMQATLTTVHIFNVNTMNALKMCTKFCTARTQHL